MYYTIYQITNKINGNIYIGAHKTNNLNDGYMSSSDIIKKAIKKYGKENFVKEILYFCESEYDMFTKEAEIVNEEFICRKDTYNLKIGGIGGFNHYNGTEQHKKSASKGGKIAAQKTNAFIKEQKNNNTEWWQNRLKSIKEENRKKAEMGLCDGWKNYSEKEREERREKISQMQKGSGNSQYGKYWISHPETKEVLRINKDDIIPEGWVRGKKGHIPKRIWVNNGITEHYIFIEKLEQHIQLNYSIGRLRKNKKIDTV